MKKLLLMLIIAAIAAVILPVAFADTYDPISGEVYIDTSWTTLNQSFTDLGVPNEASVRALVIDATDTLETVDIATINNCINMAVLDVSSSVTVNDLCTDFLVGNASIRVVQFPIVTIGNTFLQGCAALETVILSNAVNIGDNLFENCTSLENVSMPSAATFGNRCFWNCTALESISLPSAVTFSDFTFIWNNSLTSVSLPNVVEFGTDAFGACTALVNISLPSTERFGDMAFNICDALETVDIPMVNTMGAHVFNECLALTRVTMGIEPPVVGGFGGNIPAGVIVSVPYGSAASFDNDPNDLAGTGTANDGMWYLFDIVQQAAPDVQTIAENPKTGDDSINMMYVYMLLAGLLVCSGAVVIRRRAVNK